MSYIKSGFLFGLISRPERDLFCTGVGFTALTVVMSFSIFEVAAGVSLWVGGGAVVVFLLSDVRSGISGFAFGEKIAVGDGLSWSEWLLGWLIGTVFQVLYCVMTA